MTQWFEWRGEVNNDRGIEFSVRGQFALFSDPVTKTGGEKFSYPECVNENETLDVRI